MPWSTCAHKLSSLPCPLGTKPTSLFRTESPSPTDAAPVIAHIVDNGLSEPEKERLIELEKVITDRLAIGWDFSRACLLSGLD
jgi:hypothetical protein